MGRYDPTDFGRWLRQRRAIRRMRAGELEYYGQDLYDGVDVSDYDPKQYRGCLSGIILLILIVLLIMLLAKCGPFASNEPIGSVGGGTLSTTTPTTGGPGSTSSTSSTSSTTQAPPRVDDETLAGIFDLLGTYVDPTSPEFEEIRDSVNDIIDSISTETAAYQGAEVDITGTDVFTVKLTQAVADALFNFSAFECGATDPLVVCAPDALDVAAGDLLVVAVRMNADIPTDSTDKSYIYSLVFDSNGDPADNWVAHPPYDWDYFLGTDRWYQATYDHNGGTWMLGVSQVNTDGVPEAVGSSGVRAVIAGDWIVWFVPADELPDFPGAFRATAFAHDGAYTPSSRGGDVTGADPTEPLIVPPTEPIPQP